MIGKKWFYRLAAVVLTMGMGHVVVAQDAEAEPAAPADGAAAVKKKPSWEKSAAMGLTLTDGNTDTLLFTAKVDASKKWQQNEFVTGASITYGEDDQVKNNESINAFAQYNRLLTERIFALARVAFLHDDIADVDYRVTASLGVGYYFIKKERTFLSAEIGPGVVFEKQGGEASTYFTVRLAENFEHKFSERARVWQFVEFLPQVDDVENFIVNAEIGAESALTDKVKLQVYLQDTFDNRPAPGREENDFKLVSALAMTF